MCVCVSMCVPDSSMDTSSSTFSAGVKEDTCPIDPIDAAYVSIRQHASAYVGEKGYLPNRPFSSHTTTRHKVLVT